MTWVWVDKEITLKRKSIPNIKIIRAFTRDHPLANKMNGCRQINIRSKSSNNMSKSRSHSRDSLLKKLNPTRKQNFKRG